MPEARKLPKVEIQRFDVDAGTMTYAQVFCVTLVAEDAIWKDVWGSEAELLAYRRGLEAMASMLGHYLPRSELPETPVETLQLATEEHEAHELQLQKGVPGP